MLREVITGEIRFYDDCIDPMHYQCRNLAGGVNQSNSFQALLVDDDIVVEGSVAQKIGTYDVREGPLMPGKDQNIMFSGHLKGLSGNRGTNNKRDSKTKINTSSTARLTRSQQKGQSTGGSIQKSKLSKKYFGTYGV